MRNLIILLFFGFVTINTTFSQELRVVNSGDGVVTTKPFSPLTNVTIESGQGLMGEDDLMCYAVKHEERLFLVLVKPNFFDAPFPIGIKVSFLAPNNINSIEFNPKIETRHSMDYMICSISESFINKMSNTLFSSVSIKYPDGTTVTYPIHHKGSIKLHLNKLVNYK